MVNLPRECYCTPRFLFIVILTLASNDAENSLNSVRTGPKSTSVCFVFKIILRIACVAQALLIT